MRRKWKLSFLAGLGYASMSAGAVIESLRRLGYEGIEWTTAHFNPDTPLSGLREIVDRTRAAGMEVSRIMAHEDLVSLDDDVRRQRIDKTVRVIQSAGACGVRTVGTMTGPALWDPAAPKIGKDISESVAWEQVFEAYNVFTQAAKAANVVISSEGVFGMVAHDFYSHRFMMEKLDRQIHRVNLDPSHGILYGNEDVAWIVRQWGDRIAHIHLKDAMGTPRIGEFHFPLLGEGQVNWQQFFEALEEIAYQGFCSIEFESFAYYERILRSDPETAARVSMDGVKTLLERFRDAPPGGLDRPQKSD